MSDQSVHIVATITLKEGALEKALPAIKKVTEAVHKSEPEVLRYYAIQSKNQEGQDQFIFVEKYANEEAQKAHTATAHFQTLVAEISDLLAGPLDVKAGSIVAGYENRA